MPIKQDARILAIKTPLGADVLGLRSFALQEQISRPFQIEAELSSENGEVDLDKVVGHDVTIRLNVGDKAKRFFHGYVSRMVQQVNQGGYAHYRATIVPWLWFLTRTSDCRLWAADEPMKGKTVPQIIEDVFKGRGFSNYQLKLSGKYPQREFCVQYRETDFDFVSRLMEQEGIYYFFDHQDGKHTMVLADSISAHKPFSGYSDVTFHEMEHGAPVREVITDWTMKKELQPVTSALQDFDFKKPKTSLRVSSNVSRKYGQATYEMYDYPGEYIDHGDGQRLCDARLAELQTQYETLRGEANARGLAAGSIFKLKNHPRNDQNREYLITAVSLHADAGEFAAGGASNKGEFFSCNFTCIDKTQQFRPARLTPKPIVKGLQTAMVVGPKGEEIHTDKFGRVKLQFPWDRYGKADENSSCWIRVSSEWAGKNWGAIYIPRIGQEVIVEYLEGDPDRPIVTGRVYNGDALPPYNLPAEKTKSTLKSNSSKGGQGFNEIRFEDKKGSEQIFIHGEKNQDIRIKNDCLEWIGNNRHLVIKKDQIEHIENNRNETVDKDHKESIGNDRNLNVTGKEAKAVGGSLSLTVSGDVIEVFKGNHSEQTTSDYYLKADNIVIEGMTSITIKVGQSYIAIDSSGISIGTSGTIELKDSGGLTIQTQATASIQSTGAMSIKSQAQAQVQAPQVTVQADATLTLKGAMTMIN